MGREMAARVKKENCHICGDKFTIDIMADDDPFGMICLICEDKTYFQIMTLEEEDWELEEH